MKKRITFLELVDRLEEQGANLAEIAVGRIMDDIEFETGRFPDWNDPVPDDVLRVVY